MEAPASTLAPQPVSPTEKLTSTATLSASSLIGPLALLIIETSEEIEARAAILDLGASNIRYVDVEEEVLTALQWTDDGCELYLDGKVYDLEGNLVWQVPLPIVTNLGSLYSAKLSPEKNWLAYPIFSGSETYDSTELVDVEVVSLSRPYSFYRLTRRGGAEVGAFVWSPDEKWVYFSDYDTDGVLQIFRATPDGQVREQLTKHSEPLGSVDSMKLSADGHRLAYGVVNLLTASLPYEYEESDEGWVGIIDLETRSTSVVRMPKFGDVYRDGGLWWSAAGDELLVYGNSLPTEPGDALQGKQLHWIRVDESEGPFRSIYQSQVPGNSIGWVIPVSNLETLFLKTDKGYYLLYKETFSSYEGLEFLNRVEAESRIIDFIPGPISFQDQTACKE